MKKALHRAAGKRKPGQAARVPAAADAVESRFDTALRAHQVGRLDEAEAGYREVLRQNPRHAHANNNLAILLRSQRRSAEAIEFYRKAVEADPDNPSIRSNMGCALAESGRKEEALSLMRAALALQPGHPPLYFNLGNVLRGPDDFRMGAASPAGIAYRRALILNPDFAETHANLGDLYKAAGELGRAIESFMAAIRLRQDMPEPVNNLGETLKEQGRVPEAIQVFQQGLATSPGNALMHSNLLFALHYTPEIPPETIFQVHRAWGDRHARPLGRNDRRFANDRNPGRRLRVGYLSPDFCGHSCAYFAEPLIEAHDPRVVEVFCYMTSNRSDAITERFRRFAQHWRPIATISDAQAAAVIESDGIDVLIDLAGHTGDGRPLVFARRPAPVQATWLGYPDTTGMEAMGYRITDGIADPMGVTDPLHTETLVRLPRGFLAYRPSVETEGNPEPPMLRQGFVTFGSFNNIAKVSPEVVATWSAILKRVPGSRLIVKSRPLGDSPTRARYEELFATHGVLDRVELLSRIDPVENHLRAYDRLDVALDPFPYNGTTTTCEALWMGVPVVTLAGRHHVSRVGASILAFNGMVDLVAEDTAGYIERAVALATDRERLIEMRRTMRERLRAAPLTDYAGFARAMEAAYRAMWHAWLAGNP